MTENEVLPRWRHTRSVGQRVAGRAPGWSGPSRVNNKQARYRYKELILWTLQLNTQPGANSDKV